MAGEFDLHQLLAGPIIAMNDAQADAAASFYEVFEQFAFEPAQQAARGTEPEPRRLRMISFVAERATAEGVERRQISMPLLQMIPIGGVAIDSAKIEFSLAINAGPASTAGGMVGAAASAAAARRAVALKGRIAPAAGDAKTAGNLRVEIVLKQVDLPAGYLDMIAETQGGMIRLVTEASAAGEEKGPPLFSATIRDSSALRIEPRRQYELVLEIVPDRRLVGPEGLQLTFGASPARALDIIAPAGSVRLDREPRRELVRLLPGDMAKFGADVEIALLIEGEARGPDGIARSHSVRVPLPRENSGSRS